MNENIDWQTLYKDNTW